MVSRRVGSVVAGISSLPLLLVFGAAMGESPIPRIFMHRLPRPPEAPVDDHIAIMIFKETVACSGRVSRFFVV